MESAQRRAKQISWRYHSLGIILSHERGLLFRSPAQRPCRCLRSPSQKIFSVACRNQRAVQFSLYACDERRQRHGPRPFAQFADVDRHPPRHSRENQQQETTADCHPGDRYGHRLSALVPGRHHHANYKKPERSQRQNHSSGKRQHRRDSLTRSTLHAPTSQFAQHRQNQQNHQHQPQTSTRVVTPTRAIRPRGQRPQNQQDQNYQQDRSHRVPLFGASPARQRFSLWQNANLLVASFLTGRSIADSK